MEEFSTEIFWRSLLFTILENPGAVSRVGRNGATKVVKHGLKSSWVPTLTGPFLNGQANAGSWLGTKRKELKRCCWLTGHNNTKHFLCPIRSQHSLDRLKKVRWESEPRGSSSSPSKASSMSRAPRILSSLALRKTRKDIACYAGYMKLELFTISITEENKDRGGRGNPNVKRLRNLSECLWPLPFLFSDRKVWTNWRYNSFA